VAKTIASAVPRPSSSFIRPQYLPRGGFSGHVREQPDVIHRNALLKTSNLSVKCVATSEIFPLSGPAGAGKINASSSFSPASFCPCPVGQFRQRILGLHCSSTMPRDLLAMAAVAGRAQPGIDRAVKRLRQCAGCSGGIERACLIRLSITRPVTAPRLMRCKSHR